MHECTTTMWLSARSRTREVDRALPFCSVSFFTLATDQKSAFSSRPCRSMPPGSSPRRRPTGQRSSSRSCACASCPLPRPRPSSATSTVTTNLRSSMLPSPPMTLPRSPRRWRSRRGASPLPMRRRCGSWARSSQGWPRRRSMPHGRSRTATASTMRPFCSILSAFLLWTHLALSMPCCGGRASSLMLRVEQTVSRRVRSL
mmetsp:Transcript_14373/g.32819  ORF Transcript_14373/g.32819 Transcript_14373/m.32819 type:complete len:201 (+) Transcript_14373:275-877(+)